MNNVKSLPEQINAFREDIEKKMSTLDSKKHKKDDFKAVYSSLKDGVEVFTAISDRLIQLEEGKTKTKSLPNPKDDKSIDKSLVNVNSKIATTDKKLVDFQNDPINKYLFERKALCAGLSYLAVDFFKATLLSLPYGSYKTNIAVGICLYAILNKISEPFIKTLNAVVTNIIRLGGDFLKACSYFIQANFIKFIHGLKAAFTFILDQVINLAETMAKLEWSILMLVTKRIIVIPVLAVLTTHFLKPELGTAHALNMTMQFIQKNKIDVSAKNIANNPYAPIGLYIVFGLLVMGAVKSLINKVAELRTTETKTC